jgi:hypothetical protein
MRHLKTDEDFEYSTLHKVRQRLLDKGFREPPKPEGEMPGPSDNLGTLEGNAIVEEFRRIEAWHEHVTYEAMIASALVGEWKNNVKLIVAQAKKNAPDNDIELIETVIDARKRLQVHEQEAGIYDAHKSILFRRLANVSRLIEVKKIDYAGAHRGEGLGRGSWD